MTKSNIIVFPGTAAVEEAAVLPEAAERSRSGADLGQRVVTAVEAAVTALIGLCIVTCTVAVLFMV